MANLLGQNIGTNYKGILNLNTLNGNLSGSLQAVTDGDGNASLLQLSTTQVAIGGSSTGIFSIKTTASNTNGTIAFLNNNAATIAATTDTGSALTPMVFRATEYRFTDATGLVIGRGYTDSPNARLHVRGDGTNPILRLETSAGTETHIFRDSTQLQFGSQSNYISATANGTTSSTAGRGLLFVGQSGQGIHQFNFSFSNGETSGTIGGINLTGSYGVSSGSALYQPLRIAYTINNVGTPVTGTATGIFLNATETALNGMTHNLMDLQRGGVSQFSVSRVGLVSSSSGFESVSGSNRFANLVINGGTILQTTNGGGSAAIELTTAGTRLLYNSNLQFGGGTNAFPMIKRNGAGIDFRLADDTGFVPITAGDDSKIRGLFRIQDLSGNNKGLFYPEGLSGVTTFYWNGSIGVGVLGNNASARLQVDSTTQGFLPPRMTTTQVNAISSPATGLVVYSTTENALCLYNGSSWRKLNDSPL
jgi:hypothetical protein